MINQKHTIGGAISKLRREKGWTQNKLAEKLQVSDKAISKWESCKGDPSIEFLPMLADLFDVTLDYLMLGKEQEEYLMDDINHKIEVQKIENNTKKSCKEKFLKSTIHDGIVNIDELIAINDFDLYEKTLAEYPASEYEKIFQHVKNNNYKKIYEYAVTHSINSIIKDIQDKNETKIEEDFCEYLKSKHSQSYGSKFLCLDDGINKEYYYILKDGQGNIFANFNNNTLKNNNFSYEKYIELKNKIILNKVLDKDIKFIEKACKSATQEELDKALNQVEPNNFKAINILLNYGAKLHKVWTEDDGWGYMVRDEIDEIGTEILKKKIKEVLGEN